MFDVDQLFDHDEDAGFGGKIVMPKTLISEQIGHIALFMDTEGNRVGMHSMK